MEINIAQAEKIPNGMHVSYLRSAKFYVFVLETLRGHSLTEIWKAKATNVRMH